MNHKKYSMIVIGEMTLDDVVLLDAPVRLDSPGGSALYALGGAFMWKQGQIGIVARKGFDFDLSVLRTATGGEIDMAGIVELPSPSIHIWNMFDRKGHRYFILQRWGAMHDTMAPEPDDIPQEYLDNAQAFLITTMPIKWQAEIIKSMPDDAIVMVDPHYDGFYPEYQELWDELFKKITIFVPSEEELVRFFGIGQESDVSRYVPYLRKISEKGPDIVCVKVGERGAVVFDKKNESAWHIPAYCKKVVDVTGCGDSFAGGFLSSYVRDRDTYTSAVCGSISSSFNIENYGAIENFSIKNETALARYSEFASLFERDKYKIL